MARRLFTLNGPNLIMLGRREAGVYGVITLAGIEHRCQVLGHELDFDMFFAQSNFEGQLVEWVHSAYDEAAAVIINTAGLATRSVPVLDTLRMLDKPIVEVHLTNIHRREPMYHPSLTAYASWGFIAGLGASGYELAMRALARKPAESDRPRPARHPMTALTLRA